jgi:hypothetical protein
MRLKPGEPHFVDGLDWSWAFVVFAPAPGAAGYLVSSDGRAFSCWGRKSLGFGGGTETVMTDQWHELAGARDRDGYRKLILCAHGRRLYRRLHSLILDAFFGPCPPGKVGCHCNGDNTQNAAWNLRWDTQAGNISDKARHGTAGGVRQASLAAEFGVSVPTVSAIVTGRLWSHI